MTEQQALFRMSEPPGSTLLSQMGREDSRPASPGNASPPPQSLQIMAKQNSPTTPSTLIANSRPASPTSSYSESSSKHINLQNSRNEGVEASDPPFRHLSSGSSSGSIKARQSVSGAALADGHSQKSSPPSTTFEDQRHEGKRGLSITSNTKPWNSGRLQRESLRSEITQETGSVTLRNSWGNRSVGSWSGKDKAHESANIISENVKEEEQPEQTVMEEDENVYPGPLRLSILVIGIALSVFLISLDRTITTTVRPLTPHVETNTKMPRQFHSSRVNLNHTMI